MSAPAFKHLDDELKTWKPAWNQILHVWYRDQQICRASLWFVRNAKCFNPRPAESQPTFLPDLREFWNRFLPGVGSREQPCFLNQKYQPIEITDLDFTHSYHCISFHTDCRVKPGDCWSGVCKGKPWTHGPMEPLPTWFSSATQSSGQETIWSDLVDDVAWA